MPLEYPKPANNSEALAILIGQLELDHAPWIVEGAIVDPGDVPEVLRGDADEIPPFVVVSYDVESNHYTARAFRQCRDAEDEIADHATRRSAYVVAALSLRSCRSMVIQVRAQVV